MRAQPKLLFVGYGLPAGGGAERQWSLLIPALRESGFDVLLVTLVEQGELFDELVQLGVPARCVRMRHRTDLIRLRQALRYAKARPDLIVTQSINAHVAGQLIARRIKAPHVATEHTPVGPGGLAVATTQRGGDGDNLDRFGAPRAAHRALLTRLIAPRVDSVVAVSRTQIPRLLDLGYRPERLSIIHNAVPEVTQTDLSESVRDELGVPVENFLAVLVASLRPEKRIDVFIRAIQTAARRDSRISGIVVGGGPESGRLSDLVDDDGPIRLIGHRSDVADILGAADVVCLSSDAEASPMTILEAMSAGKPVVATDVGGIYEAVINEETGLLVPARDAGAFASALLRLASDPSLAGRMGEAARMRHRALFSTSRMVTEYAEYFERVLEARRSAPRRP
jgi:glycosyltransferase involved in cell wall biosynthesis